MHVQSQLCCFRMIPKYGTGLRLPTEQMSNIVIRYIETAKKKAANYKVDALRYRGVVYKELTK